MPVLFELHEKKFSQKFRVCRRGYAHVIPQNTTDPDGIRTGYLSYSHNTPDHIHGVRATGTDLGLY